LPSSTNCYGSSGSLVVTPDSLDETLSSADRRRPVAEFGCCASQPVEDTVHGLLTRLNVIESVGFTERG
jgi:hypothetical protein